jgi:hypothetical protein
MSRAQGRPTSSALLFGFCAEQRLDLVSFPHQPGVIGVVVPSRAEASTRVASNASNGVKQLAIALRQSVAFFGIQQFVHARRRLLKTGRTSGPIDLVPATRHFQTSVARNQVRSAGGCAACAVPRSCVNLLARKVPRATVTSRRCHRRKVARRQRRKRLHRASPSCSRSVGKADSAKCLGGSDPV